MNIEALAQAGIDVKELMDRFMNNETLVRMIIGKFVNDQTCAQLKDAVARQDMQAAEFACHSLKGVCGNLSLKKLFAMLQEQLRLFRAGEHAAAVAMTNEICAEYDKALDHLKLWLQ